VSRQGPPSPRTYTAWPFSIKTDSRFGTLADLFGGHWEEPTIFGQMALQDHIRLVVNHRIGRGFRDAAEVYEVACRILGSTWPQYPGVEKVPPGDSAPKNNLEVLL